jgi:hypothetical protein
MPVWLERSGFEVDNPGWCVERPRVHIPLIDSRGDAPVRASQYFDGANSFGFGDGISNRILVALRGALAANLPGHVEHGERVFDFPVSACPGEPFAPCGNVTKVFSVPGGEKQRKAIFRKFWRHCVTKKPCEALSVIITLWNFVYQERGR